MSPARGGLKPPFVLVTGNRDKRREAERILGCRIEAVDLDLPEIQSDDLHEVLQAKAGEAWNRVGGPLVVEETGLELDAMGGFPGPLVKWMLKRMGPEGVARTAIELGDPRVVARCMLLYRDGEGDVLGVGVSPGRLVLPGRGGGGFGWDPFFVAEGENETSAQLAGEAKDRVAHRGRAWRALCEALRRERAIELGG